MLAQAEARAVVHDCRTGRRAPRIGEAAKGTVGYDGRTSLVSASRPGWRCLR
jgi:hypothetical protein